MKKICKDCHKEKNVSEYYGVQRDCKDCYKSRVKSQKERFGIKKKCPECGKEFKSLMSEINRGGGKTCSRVCFFNRMRKLLDIKFKDKTTYHSLHKWVYKNMGRAIKCSQCGSEKTIEWANISGKYKQDLKDWKQLCKKCHHKFDDVSKKLWEARRRNGTDKWS